MTWPILQYYKVLLVNDVSQVNNFFQSLLLLDEHTEKKPAILGDGTTSQDYQTAQECPRYTVSMTTLSASWKASKAGKGDVIYQQYHDVDIVVEIQHSERYTAHVPTSVWSISL